METFRSLNGASIDAKISQLQSVVIEKGEHIVKYYSRIFELILELEIAGHDLATEMEQKQAFQRRLQTYYNVSVESIMIVKDTFSGVV